MAKRGYYKTYKGLSEARKVFKSLEDYKSGQNRTEAAYEAVRLTQEAINELEGSNQTEKALRAYEYLLGQLETFPKYGVHPNELLVSKIRGRIYQLTTTTNPRAQRKRSGIESIINKSGKALSILGILGGIIFLSSNITGNVVANITKTTSNWIGGILFAVGLTGLYIYFKKK